MASIHRFCESGEFTPSGSDAFGRELQPVVMRLITARYLDELSLTVLLTLSRTTTHPIRSAFDLADGVASEPQFPPLKGLPHQPLAATEARP
jgi:hypothetical protein